MTADPLRERYENIVRRLDEPKLGNPKYGQDRARVEGELRAVAREAIDAAPTHPHDGYAYDGCDCVCCTNVRALAHREPDGLDVAWAEVEKALPDGWKPLIGRDDGGWWATASEPYRDGGYSITSTSQPGVLYPTMVDALRVLAARLADPPEDQPRDR